MEEFFGIKIDDLKPCPASEVILSWSKDFIKELDEASDVRAIELLGEFAEVEYG